MRVTSVEALVNNYPGSRLYGVPFGVALVYSDNHVRRFTDLEVARCAFLSQGQRRFIDRVEQAIIQNKRIADV